MAGHAAFWFQVARSLGILDEVNRMKVVPGTSPSSSVTSKNVRYLGVTIFSRMLSKILGGCFWYRLDLGFTTGIQSELGSAETQM